MPFSLRANWKKNAIALLIVIVLGAVGYYYFLAEHVMLSKADTRSQLRFTAFCKFSDYSYRTYVRVSTANSRTISLNEIPYSADMLSDCFDQSLYRVIDLRPDPTYQKLLVYFEARDRTPVEVPLLLRGLDLPVPEIVGKDN